MSWRASTTRTRALRSGSPDGRVADFDDRMLDRGFADRILPFIASDASFALDRMAAVDRADPWGVLTGRIDLAHTGLFDPSLGGEITGMGCMKDTRFRARCTTISPPTATSSASPASITPTSATPSCSPRCCARWDFPARSTAGGPPHRQLLRARVLRPLPQPPASASARRPARNAAGRAVRRTSTDRDGALVPWPVHANCSGASSTTPMVRRWVRARSWTSTSTSHDRERGSWPRSRPSESPPRRSC